MEDDSNKPLDNLQALDHVKNGLVDPTMANFPEGTVTEAKEKTNPTEPSKVNGEGFQESLNDPFDDTYSSGSDALVIDESVPKKRRTKTKYSKKTKDRRMSEKENDGDLSNPSDSKEKLNSDLEKVGVTNDLVAAKSVVPTNDLHNFFSSTNTNENSLISENFSANSDSLDHRSCETITEPNSHCGDNRLSNDDSCTNQELLAHSNPYFNESLFELSQLHHTSSETLNNISNPQNLKDNTSRALKVSKVKPRIKEYAQYLGLQPAVQFKCPKCGKSGFESLLTLQDHFQQCNSIQSLEKTTGNENVSGFKLTRKVFLCSRCGTYYENWNLYMHMLEHHRRYVCLYCLGLFSVLDDLCQHIQSRHNLEPGVKNSLEDFYNTYNEPCYIVCCECSRQFNEGDDFFYHNCTSKQSGKGKSKQIKQVIAPEQHVTGDFGTETCEKTDVVAQKPKSSTTKNNLQLPVKLSNIPANPQPVRFQVDSDNSDKHNINKVENLKLPISDPSENVDSIAVSKDPQESTANDLNPKSEDSPWPTDSIERNCEQDSLDSIKASEENRPASTEEGTMDDTEDNFSDTQENYEAEEEHREPVETRKVPKLSLKLPKPGSYPQSDLEDSDDSDKLAVDEPIAGGMDIDNIESENENDRNQTNPEKLEADQEVSHLEEYSNKLEDSQYTFAGLEVPVIELELDQPLEKMDIRVLLQKCLRETVPLCIYCNHSRRIAVNGKQLALHAMAEHRYSAINKSITEEELIPESFNSRIKECLGELENVFFNLDSGVSDEAVTFSHVFECFQCRFSSTVHKELYLHNRKYHSKNLLLCIMCKSNFYSYSELICHLCPGVYVLDYDLQFRCCMCVSDDLPSSFRLLVHLRKRHNVCDVCLEMCHSQYKLSNHVWKHKLHHFCYRCGIAYRNKPDITRHLFWKHGTESVLCKKCLQKKWPHVYHFCVPPASFVCEECNLVFTKAVSVKVHKRLHSNEKKHFCTWEDCSEVFISKKLALKHLMWHTNPPEEQEPELEIKQEQENKEDKPEGEEQHIDETKEVEGSPKQIKPKVDVYDLPELNLSESDSSDSETEQEKPKVEENNEMLNIEESKGKPVEDKAEANELEEPEKGSVAIAQANNSAEQQATIDTSPQQVVDEGSSIVMQDIWDNFKNYQASKEKLDHMFTGEIDTRVDEPYIPDIPIPVVEEGISCKLALLDHDYCLDPEKVQSSDAIIEVKPALQSTESMDHDYCFQKEMAGVKPTAIEPILPLETQTATQSKSKKSPSRKRTSSSSSSSSDSDSSCACGSSCSCSDSSSGSSSSSSDSSNSDSSTEEGRKRQQQRRLKRKERARGEKKERQQKEVDAKVDVITTDQPPVAVEMPIHESDLETTESETDEEFYDREPHKFAKKILEERRAQLLAEMGPNMIPNGSFIESTSRPPTPPAGTVEEEDQPKKKKKTKKRKKRKSEKKLPLDQRTYSSTLIMPEEPVVEPPASVPYYQQFHQMERQSPTVAPITLSIARNSPVATPQTPPLYTPQTPMVSRQDSTASDSSVRSSKRRRVPNKFYGYSSDEEEKLHSTKRTKLEINRTIPAPSPPMLVPPITIKTQPSPMAAPPRPPVVEPIMLRLPKPSTNDFRGQGRPTVPPLRLSNPRQFLVPPQEESGSESNESDFDESAPQPNPVIQEPPKPPQPQLYCYCRCPYDEVSEMIGCDSNDCEIEWFHFECVGIMVPPKGQWFCPDCRKKKQQRRELLA